MLVWKFLGLMTLTWIVSSTGFTHYLEDTRDDRFMDWLKTHSNNENAILEYSLSKEKNIIQRNILVNDLLDIVRQLAQPYSYGGDLTQLNKRNFWQPMGGPLPVETRLVSFGNRLQGEGGTTGPGSSNKAMRYGR